MAPKRALQNILYISPQGAWGAQPSPKPPPLLRCPCMPCNCVKNYFKSKAIINSLFYCQLATCSGDVSPLLKISMEI